jgi:hypothetical protein
VTAPPRSRPGRQLAPPVPDVQDPDHLGGLVDLEVNVTARPPQQEALEVRPPRGRNGEPGLCVVSSSIASGGSLRARSDMTRNISRFASTSSRGPRCYSAPGRRRPPGQRSRRNPCFLVHSESEPGLMPSAWAAFRILRCMRSAVRRATTSSTSSWVPGPVVGEQAFVVVRGHDRHAHPLGPACSVGVSVTRAQGAEVALVAAEEDQPRTGGLEDSPTA